MPRGASSADEGNRVEDARRLAALELVDGGGGSLAAEVCAAWAAEGAPLAEAVAWSLVSLDWAPRGRRWTLTCRWIRSCRWTRSYYSAPAHHSARSASRS